MVARVVDRDLGWRALLRRADATGTARVLVGIHADDGAEAASGGAGQTVVAVASFHEFGLGVPQRSWLRAGIDENRGEINKLTRRLGRAIISNRRRLSANRALDLLGLDIVAKLQARIRAGIPPENAPKTIEAKGSSVPLIDTGQMIQSITSRVTGRR